MNLEQLKKNVGQIVRLRPIAHRYDEDGQQLEQIDDDWSIMQVSDAGVTVMNLATQHTRTLFRDQIHHYASDTVTQGRVRGFLVLNIQIYLVGLEIQVEPCLRPGETVDRPPPLKRESNLLGLAARLQSKLNDGTRNRAFQTSPEGIREADTAFFSLPEHFRSIAHRMRAVMPSLDLQIRQHAQHLAVIAFGYGVLLTWQRTMNDLKDSALTITYWQGHPPFPGLVRLPGLPDSDEEPYEMLSEEFTYGFASSGEHMWIECHGQRRQFSSAHLAESILEMVFHFRGSPIHD